MCRSGNNLSKITAKLVCIALTVLIFSQAAICEVSAETTAAATPAASAAAATQTPPNTEAPVMTVDIVIFAGQSNMSGTGGNAALAPAVPNGQGYEFRPMSDMSGLHQIVEPFGVMESGWLADPAARKKGSLVSSFVTNYYARCGVPVVAVPASRGDTTAGYFASPSVKSELYARLVNTKTYLEANHIKVRRMFAVWLQGESDAIKGTSSASYKESLSSAFQPLFAASLDQVYIITPGRARGNLFDYSSIINAQKELCASSDLFTLASTTLTTLPDSYFSDEVHYNQTALNMVGAEAAAVSAR